MTYEVGIGGTVGAPTATGHYAWLDNVPAAFLLVYDGGTDLVGLSIGGVLVQEGQLLMPMAISQAFDFTYIGENGDGDEITVDQG